MFTLRIFPYRAGLVCSTDAAINREILTDQERFAGGDAAYLLEPIVGARSLILTPAPTHLGNRKLLLPAFHGERVASWTDRVQELAVEQVPSLGSGGVAAVRPWAQRLTLDVILRVVFGLDDRARVDAYRRAIQRLTTFTMQALLFAPEKIRLPLGPRSPGGMMRARREALHVLIREEITLRRRDVTGQHNDVLSVLIDARDEHGKALSDGQLCDELTGLVIAGHETTATALAWTLHLLAHTPLVRDALIEDLDGGRDELLRAVIKESLRLRPPVLDAVRTATSDLEVAGHPVPKDAFVSAMFCVTHHDPELWPEPERFRPERHLDNSSAPYALTPFGGGVRRCLGAPLAQLELEVVLRTVLAGWVPEPAGDQERPRLHGVTIIPTRGGRIRLTRRPGSTTHTTVRPGALLSG